MAVSYLLLLREPMYLLFYLLYITVYANILSFTTSMQHIGIARTIKSLLGLYTGCDGLGEEHGRLSR